MTLDDVIVVYDVVNKRNTVSHRGENNLVIVFLFEYRSSKNSINSMCLHNEILM